MPPQKRAPQESSEEPQQDVQPVQPLPRCPICRRIYAANEQPGVCHVCGYDSARQ